MKTIQINLYQFNELSDEAKVKALDYNRSFNVEDEWLNCTYDDMENIGSTIKSFNLERKEIEIELNKPINEIINTILVEHGKDTDTYNVAKYFEKQVNETHHEGLQQDALVVRMFKLELGKVYIKMLELEYDYLTSDKAVEESLVINGYYYLPDGNSFEGIHKYKAINEAELQSNNT